MKPQKNLPSREVTINGTVVTAGGRPSPNTPVTAFIKNIGSLDPVGKTNTDTDGYYEIAYKTPKNKDKKINQSGFLVLAYDKSGNEIARSKINFSNKTIVSIDIVIPGQTMKTAEFDAMTAALE